MKLVEAFTPAVEFEKQLGEYQRGLKRYESMVINALVNAYKNIPDEHDKIEFMKKVVDRADEKAFDKGHMARVGKLTQLLARACYDDDIVGYANEDVWYGVGAMHDIGGIFLPNVKRIQGQNDVWDTGAINQHPSHGAAILIGTGYNQLVNAAAYHHETWNGMGYPARLSRDRIPAEARLVAVTNIYDKVAQDLGHDAAHRMINELAGIELDPNMTACFLKLKDSDICNVYEIPDQSPDLERIDSLRM